MTKWIVGCLSVVVTGILCAVLVPQVAALGVVVSVLGLIALMQVLLTAIVLAVTKPNNFTTTALVHGPHRSDFARLLWAYGDFKIFLGRVVGIIGLVYGIITHSFYFALLGATATMLFWALDRWQDWRIEDLRSRAATSCQNEEAVDAR
jgi:hypothetical protein